jgi:uroporphyrinogen-III synthase
VVVTRAREQASELVDELERLGAEVVVAPAIEIIEPSDGGAALRAAVASMRAGVASGTPPDWVVFTSANAVRRFCARFSGSPELPSVQVAVIGSGTAAVATGAGLPVDLVPDRFVAEGLLEVFPASPPGGGLVLLPRAEVARDVLPDGLRAKGWSVEVVPAYRTVPAVVDDSVRTAVARADAVCFASASSVSAFADAYGSDVPSVVAVIGPVTATRARDLGLEVAIQPDEHTFAAMAEALARYFDTDRRDPR